MNSASLLPALSVRNDCGFVLHLRTPKLTAVALQNRVLLHSCMQNHTGCCWGISRSVALFDFFLKIFGMNYSVITTIPPHVLWGFFVLFL